MTKICRETCSTPAGSENDWFDSIDRTIPCAFAAYGRNVIGWADRVWSRALRAGRRVSESRDTGVLVGAGERAEEDEIRLTVCSRKVLTLGWLTSRVTAGLLIIRWLKMRERVERTRVCVDGGSGLCGKGQLAQFHTKLAR